MAETVADLHEDKSILTNKIFLLIKAFEEKHDMAVTSIDVLRATYAGHDRFIDSEIAGLDLTIEI